MQGHFKVITLCGSTRLKDGAIQESGTAIAAILPPLPLFSKDRARSEKKAFYDILIALRDQYNFEYGEDITVDGIIVTEKCKNLARKVKEIIDTKSSFADWLNIQNIRDRLKYDIKVCLVKNGYPPQYSPEVFNKVMEQVENFEENN